MVFPVREIIAAQSPVLLFLSKQDQADTLGYNIVNELAPLVYQEIMSGRAPLWDSPEKSVQIQPSSLKSIEESIGDKFIHAKQLFIYELWDLDKKKGELETIGFYFSTRTIRGEEVSFGFVEYPVLENVLRNSVIPSNANGNNELTFYEVLKSKYYFFNVVQVAERKITNIKEALALKEEVKLFVDERTVKPPFDSKEITYKIISDIKDSTEQAIKSNRFIQSLQIYLNANKEIFYNLGGDRIYKFTQSKNISITSVEILEHWRKVGDQVETELIAIKIFAEKEPLNTISRADMHFVDFIVDFKSVSDFLNEKEFYFRIIKINNQEIVEAESEAFLKGLRSWKWNQLTEFVRYE